ncbi:SIMPL domain-containing protein [Acidovorax lacteus]|uniref:DUF541 domain-containing protein n=1 Tax=Acidovorax lacteus TaxID=1924988 RepID=A0ABP8LI42_9BURK
MNSIPHRKVWLLAALLALGGVQVAHAQAPVAALAEPHNVVQLSASGTVEVAQDLLVLTLAATRDGADAAAVQAQLKQVLDAALAEARRQAQPGQLEVRTGSFGLYPRHGKDGRISGWQGRAELVLEGRDFARITAVAGRIQGMPIQQVGFGLSREARNQVETAARTQAIEQFRQRASELTRSFGFAQYSLREVSVSDSEQMPPPRPRMMMAMEAKSAAMADAPVPVEAGKTQVTVSVSGSVQMR